MRQLLYFARSCINTELIIAGLSGDSITASKRVNSYVACIAFNVNRIIRFLAASNIIDYQHLMH